MLPNMKLVKEKTGLSTEAIKTKIISKLDKIENEYLVLDLQNLIEERGNLDAFLQVYKKDIKLMLNFL